MRTHLFLGLALSLGLSQTLTASAQTPGTSETTKPTFRISKETTCITEPLTATGLVDYPAYLNRELSQGVTPENNAAVLYWQAIGKSKEILDDPRFFENLKRELGTDPFAGGGPTLVNYGKAYEAVTGSTINGQDENAWDEFNKSQESPWQAADLPTVAKWLELNAKPLETVVAATKRTQYFRPLVSSDDTYAMIAILLPDVQQHREIARLLTARAMLALGENRPQVAINDLLAMHRLARHTAKGTTLIEMLVGVAIEAVAHQGDQLLASSASPTSEQLTRYAQQLEQLPPPADISRSYQSERFFGLDVIQRLATAQLNDNQDQNNMMELLGMHAGSETMGKLLSMFFQYGLDWNTVLIGFNDYHDQVQAALAQPDFAQQEAAMIKLRKQLETEVQNVNTPANLALSIFATPEQRASQMKTVLLGLLAPAFESAQEAGTRAAAKAELSTVGIALSAYYKQEGVFPDSLNALVPRYLPELPLDPYTGQSFVYGVDNQGALLYSLGKNLKDDGGKLLNEDYQNHDHVFRVQGQ